MPGFSALVSEFQFLETQMRQSLATGRPPDESGRFLRLCADMLDRIESYVPETPDEARDQIFFFIKRGMRGCSLSVGERDIDIALTLSARNFSDMPRRASGLGGREFRPESASIIDYVCGSVERASFIDTGFRYVATSAGNAEFYGSRPVRIVGTHVAELIGSKRFETRGKPRLEAAFRGDPQCYLHSISHAGRTRIMSCQMKPVRRRTGEVDGAVVYLRDVTGDLPKLIREASMV